MSVNQHDRWYDNPSLGFARMAGHDGPLREADDESQTATPGDLEAVFRDLSGRMSADYVAAGFTLAGAQDSLLMDLREGRAHALENDGVVVAVISWHEAGGLVIDALTFLRQWPVGRRGPVYRSAQNCCAAAIAGEMTAEQACRSFVGFARITRLLAERHPSPSVVDPAAKKQREARSIV